MSIEYINIRVYNGSGEIDATLSPAISIYDNADSSSNFSGTMTWNTTTLNYQFSVDIDPLKTYTATVDFGEGALTRYTTFGVSYSGTLTPTQDSNLARAAKALTRNEFIALQNP